jgi:hypothetical protein
MFSVSSYISSLHHQKDDTFYILHTIAPFSSGTFLPKISYTSLSILIGCFKDAFQYANNQPNSSGNRPFECPTETHGD